MKRAVSIGFPVLALALFAASEAAAEPFVVTSTTVSTSGTFSCRGSITCTGEGTDTVTIGSGANTATISFTGANLSFDVTNELTRVTMGSLDMTASDGFTFPVRTSNPTGLPVLNFALTTHQSDPVSRTSTRLWEFGPGGHGTIPVMVGNGYQVLGLGGTAGGGYHSTVYTYRPFPVLLSPGTVSLTADAGAVPEPATLVLLGTGLIG